MQAFRVFLYVTLPLLGFSALKGGSLYSVSFLEAIIYIVLFGVYCAFLVSFFSKGKGRPILEKKFAIKSFLFLSLVWLSILLMYMFDQPGLCKGFDPCDLISYMKLLISYLMLMPPFGFILYSQKKMDQRGI